MIRIALIDAALVCSLSLVGCSPEYNWREWRATEDGYEVMFPAKPASVVREINLNGQRVPMKLTATEAGGHSFAVGIVSLPAGQQVDQQAERDRAVMAMQAQMMRNISASTSASTPITIPILDASGKARASVPGSHLVAKGTAEPNQLNGGFAARGSRAYQFMVIGTDPDPEVAKIFVDSFRFVE